MEWIKRNLMRLLHDCSKIVFVNVAALDIEGEVMVTSNVTIESENKMKLNFRRNASFIIE